MKTFNRRPVANFIVTSLVVASSSFAVTAYARPKSKWVFERIIFATNGGENLPLCQEFLTELKSSGNAKVLQNIDAPPRFILGGNFKPAKWRDVSVDFARWNGAGIVFESPFLPKGPESAFRAEAANFDSDQDGIPETMLRIIHKKTGYWMCAPTLASRSHVPSDLNWRRDMQCDIFRFRDRDYVYETMGNYITIRENPVNSIKKISDNSDNAVCKLIRRFERAK